MRFLDGNTGRGGGWLWAAMAVCNTKAVHSFRSGNEPPFAKREFCLLLFRIRYLLLQRTKIFRADHDPLLSLFSL
jgi:hypothetical protein